MYEKCILQEGLVEPKDFDKRVVVFYFTATLLHDRKYPRKGLLGKLFPKVTTVRSTSNVRLGLAIDEETYNTEFLYPAVGRSCNDYLARVPETTWVNVCLGVDKLLDIMRVKLKEEFDSEGGEHGLPSEHLPTLWNWLHDIRCHSEIPDIPGLFYGQPEWFESTKMDTPTLVIEPGLTHNGTWGEVLALALIGPALGRAIAEEDFRRNVEAYTLHRTLRHRPRVAFRRCIKDLHDQAHARARLEENLALGDVPVPTAMQIAGNSYSLPAWDAPASATPTEGSAVTDTMRETYWARYEELCREYHDKRVRTRRKR